MNKSRRDNEQMPPSGGNVLAMLVAVPRPGDAVAELLGNGYLPQRALETRVGLGGCRSRAPGTRSRTLRELCTKVRKTACNGRAASRRCRAGRRDPATA